MSKKIEDQVLDRKTKEQIRQELLEVINTTYKDEIAQDVVKDVRATFNNEYKQEIKEEIETELVDEIKEDIRKEQSKLSRKKSFKIFRLYIYILLLIALIGYLVYQLYVNGGLALLDDYEIVKKDPSIVDKNDSNSVVKDFNYYNDKYGYLMNNVYITNIELLKGNYNMSSIDVKDRLAMAYKTLSQDDISIEGIIYTVSAEKLMVAYQKLFGTVDNYKNTNFVIEDLNFAYQDSTKSYIAIKTSNEMSDRVFNIITDIKEDGNLLVFTSKVALIRDNNIYNVFNLDVSLGEYVDELDLNNYIVKLHEVNYTFTNTKGEYFLTNVSLKN